MQSTDNVRRLSPDDTSTEAKPIRNRHHGHVIDCNGTHAIIAADVVPGDNGADNYWAVGQLISISRGSNRIVGQCFKVEAPSGSWQAKQPNLILIHVELVGEIQEAEDRSVKFSSGITGYPTMGANAHRIRAVDLEAIYENTAERSIQVGHLTQESSIPARIDLDKLLTRHFAVVGSTGVGKSTSVSLLLRKIIETREDIRVLVLDPHNEFACSFGDKAVVKDARNLHLPFWLFRFDEFREVVFRGQIGVDTEVEMLRDLVAEAKERFSQGEENAAKSVRRNNQNQGYTADSPVPYRIVDLLKIIDERMGQLDGRHEKPILKSLLDRVTSINRDPRFAFMFNQAAAGGDRMKTVISDLFRVPTYGKPISVIEMSALPSEIVNSVVSVLCRMAFDLAMSSNGAVQTLVVCEEAHRYIPSDSKAGFWPTRQAVARIAKEGRKYGVYLGIITQRPSELDPTILSQCNTVFAMRLSNRADQQIIGGAITNGAQSTVGFLASIQNRECIAFGEAINTPMRMTFETIRQELLPGSTIKETQSAVREGMAVDLNTIVKRMRDDDKEPGDDLNGFDSGTTAGVPQREITPEKDGCAKPPPQAETRQQQSLQQRPSISVDPPPERASAPTAPPEYRPKPLPTQAPLKKPDGNRLLESYRIRK